MPNPIKQLLGGKKPDKKPVFLIIDNFYYPTNLSNPKRFNLDEGPMLSAIKAAYGLFNQDGLVVFPAPARNPYEFLGCRIEYNEIGIPLYVSNAVNNEKDIDRVPVRNIEGSRLNIIREVKNFSGDSFIAIQVISAFELACLLRGVKESYLELKRNPGLMKKLIKRALEISKASVDGYISAGVDNITIKNSLASSSMISPAMYLEFAFEADKELVRYVKDKGASATLHICRLSEPIMDLMVATGADILEIDSPNNIEKVARIVGRRAILKGNLDALNDVYKFDKKKLAQKLNKLDKIPNLIVSTGDSVPFKTEKDNINFIISYFE